MSSYKLISKLWSYITPRRKKQFYLLMVLILASSFAEVLSIGAIVPFLSILTDPDVILSNEYIKNNSIIDLYSLDRKELVFYISIIFSILAIFAGTIRLFLLYVSIRISNSTGADLSVDVYRKTLYQPYQVHISRNTSEIISGITQKVSIASSTLTSIVAVVSSIFIFISIIVALFYIDPYITVVSIVTFSLIYIGIALLSKNRLLENGQIVSIENNNVIKSLQEGLGGIRDVILDNSQGIYCRIYENSIFKLRKASSENSFFNQYPRFALEAIGLVLIAGLAVLFSDEKGDLTSAIPALGALGMGAQRLLPLLQQIYGNWSQLESTKAMMVDVFSLLDQRVGNEYENKGYGNLQFDERIEFKNVSFQYSGANLPVIQNTSFSVRKGSRVGIIGSTGSGKSTVMDLFMGLIFPTTGKIYIDSTILDNKTYLPWQRNIAHVPQSVFLTDSTILENIAFGIEKEDINLDLVIESAKKAQLWDFIQALPNQLNTTVGERGIRLSGGQKQRIGIARAIYKNAKVIFFDEATSALDDETEKSVMDSIYGLSSDLTIFIIAHRLNTLKNCDMILEVKNGEVELDFS